jgi:hypothetical protein
LARVKLAEKTADSTKTAEPATEPAKPEGAILEEKKEEKNYEKNEEKNVIGFIITVSGKELEVYPSDLSGEINLTSARMCCRAFQKKQGSEDWRLPTKEEFEQIYLQLHKKGKGNFKSASYWSSTKNDNGNAWNFSFENGTAYGNNEIKTSYVRTVRTLKHL